jgi:uncharacterized protein with ATP-grasp and redox domains
MHCHTFFSFNAYGHSPTSLAWLAKRRGFKLMGIVDFDVLDGVDEFLDACEVVGVRGSAGMETRVFLPEFATREINSPGEPGVCYHMGIGFTSSQVPETAASILDDLRQRAARRNQVVVERINAHLAPVTIDYERDVLPLTPGGTATERHIVVAYIRATEHIVSNPVEFWADKLDVEPDQVVTLLDDAPRFQNLVRAKLMKRGGVGYVQPGPDTFPTVEEFHTLIVQCGALPCAAWLDGTSEGEQAIEELLDLLINKGVVALNIIPDRNWNIADPETRRVKVQNLYHVVRLAQELALPLNVGTEMNSFGQKLVDDFDAPELAPVRQAFMDGAYFIYGHTVLQRALGLGYQSEWAQTHLPSRRERNDFYTRVGYQVPPGRASMARLKQLVLSSDLSLLKGAVKILSTFSPATEGKGSTLSGREEMRRPGSTRHDAGLPPPLMTSEPGSFARSTIVERKPQIIRQVIEDNNYPPHIVGALEAFRQEIASQPMQPLHEQAPDVAFWNRELAAYQGKTWLDAPWYFAETFFYRRLLEAVHYFQPGPREGHDPFGKQKRQQEEAAVERLAESWSQLADVEPEVVFEALLHSCLWGNRADLSNYTVALRASSGLAAREERRHILTDHTDEVGELLASSLPRVDFVNDNVGLELLFDLALADFLLVQGMAREVVFHLKARPFFVSDAMPKDARATVALLRMAPDAAVRELGARLHEHLAGERLVLKDHPFWTSCLMFRQMPPSLRTELERSNLVILKGDVNYRRLLDDRHWPHTTRLEEVADYFPAPFLVLRTLKGEIMIGLKPGQAEALAAEDPTWLINGKRGIVQLVTKKVI